MDELNADSLGGLLHGRMGLIVGPGLTDYPGVLTELAQHVAALVPQPAQLPYLASADNALSAGASEDQVKQAIRDFLQARPAPPVLSTLAKGKWCAVLSGSLDSHLEGLLQQELQKSPLMRPDEVIESLDSASAGRTLPVYKLVGMYERDSFAYCSAEYARRRAYWRYAVKGFADRAKGNPVLCIGMAECEWVLFDLIAEFIAERTVTPSRLVFLADDPLIGNQTLARIARDRVKTVRVAGSLNELVRSLAAAHRLGYTPPESPSPDRAYGEYDAYRDVVVVVNSQLQSSVTSVETTLLLDLLFSPSVPRWEPFRHSLDFPRTISDDLLKKVLGRVAGKRPAGGAFVVHGASATGKTIILKRLAYDIAKAGTLVFWFPQSLLRAGRPELRRLFKTVLKHEPSGVVVAFVDDPLAIGALSVSEIVDASVEAGVTLFVVAGMRSSEWHSVDYATLLGNLNVLSEHPVPDALDAGEWSALPAYLVKLGIAASVQDAQRDVDAASGRSAGDTLSTLYFLLPQTKAQISASVRDEYLRLGDLAGLSRVVLAGATHTTALLKQAYSYVAVADRYGVALPIEVLVSALSVDYSEWVDATPAEGAAWGLLYSFESESGDTICYRTRNSIVTRLLIEVINGGSLSRVGELRYLREMIGACSSRASTIYREFCTEVLVNNVALQSLKYEDGLALFDQAIAALPYQDKTLLHHRALWIKNKGKDPLKAISYLKECLKAQNYPYVQKVETNEHVYTSLAAAVVDAIDREQISVTEGKEEAYEYLRKARSNQFVNANAVHVEAQLTLRLMGSMPSDAENDRFLLAANCVADIDRTLMVLDDPFRAYRRVDEKRQWLETVRDKLFVAVGTEANLADQAESLWEKYRSQAGFTLNARRLLCAAVNSNRGTDFNNAYSYCEACVELVRKEGSEPALSLLEVELQTYYSWQVKRAIYSEMPSPIDWSKVEAVAGLLAHGQDGVVVPLHQYLYGLALAHLGEWGKANAQFAALRRCPLPMSVLWAPRDFLLGPNGKARLLQGRIQEGVDRLVFFADDLQRDFYADRGERWNKPGEVDWAYLQFAFAGPIAVDRHTVIALPQWA